MSKIEIVEYNEAPSPGQSTVVFKVPYTQTDAFGTVVEMFNKEHVTISSLEDRAKQLRAELTLINEKKELIKNFKSGESKKAPVEK